MASDNPRCRLLKVDCGWGTMVELRDGGSKMFSILFLFCSGFPSEENKAHRGEVTFQNIAQLAAELRLHLDLSFSNSLGHIKNNNFKKGSLNKT